MIQGHTMSDVTTPILLVAEVVLVVAAVVVHALDPDYQAYYTAFGTLVTVQIVSVVVGWARLHDPGRTFGRHLARATSFACFFLALLATIQASRDAGHCLENDEEDRKNANECIDLYSSYAALDGPHGVQNACVTLGKPVASLLGGVCLNVEYGGSTGTALLVLQIVWAGLLLVVNGMQAFSGSPSAGDEKDEEVLNSVISADAGADDAAAKKKKVTTATRRPVTRLMKSVYYGALPGK